MDRTGTPTDARPSPSTTGDAAPLRLLHIPLPGAPLEALRRLPAKPRQSLASAGLVVPKSLAGGGRTPAALGWLATRSQPTPAWKRALEEIEGQPAIVSASSFATADAISAARVVRELRPGAIVLVVPPLPVQLYTAWQEDVLAGSTATWASRLADRRGLRPDPVAAVRAWSGAFPNLIVLPAASPDAADPVRLWTAAGMPAVPALDELDEVAGRIPSSRPIGYAEVSLVRRLNAELEQRGASTAEWRALVGAGLVPRLREAAISVETEVLLTSDADAALRRAADQLVAALPAAHPLDAAQFVPDALPSLLDEPATVDRDVAIAAAYGLVEARLAMGEPRRAITSQVPTRSLVRELRARFGRRGRSGGGRR